METKETLHPLFSWKRDSATEKDEEGRPACFSLMLFPNSILVFRRFHPQENDGHYSSVETYNIANTPYEKSLAALLKKNLELVRQAPPLVLEYGEMNPDDRDYIVLANCLSGNHINRSFVGPIPPYYKKKDFKKYQRRDWQNALGEFLEEVLGGFLKAQPTLKKAKGRYECHHVNADFAFEVSLHCDELVHGGQELFHKIIDETASVAFDKLPDNLSEEEFERLVKDRAQKKVDKGVKALVALLKKGVTMEQYDQALKKTALAVAQDIDPHHPSVLTAQESIEDSLYSSLAEEQTIPEEYLPYLHPRYEVLYGYACRLGLTEGYHFDEKKILALYRLEAKRHGLFPYLYQLTPEGAMPVLHDNEETAKA